MNREPIPQPLNTQFAEVIENNDNHSMQGFTQAFNALALEEYVDDLMDIDPQPSNSDSVKNTLDFHQVYGTSDTISMLCGRLLCEGVITRFFTALESTATPWSRLLHDTTVPHDAGSEDSRYVRAFKALDLAIRVPDSSCPLLPRLAMAQLYRLIKVLEARIARDRKAGGIATSSGYGDASIALDIYATAQSQPSPPSRGGLSHRKRLAKRWSELAGPWPLFVLIYSKEAENIMFVLGSTPSTYVLR